MYEIEKVAASIRAKRAEKRVTQEELALAIGVSRDAIAAWENAQNKISFENAWRLADYFGCSLDQMFGRKL